MRTENQLVTSISRRQVTLRDVIAVELADPHTSSLLNRLEGQLGVYIRTWAFCHSSLASTREDTSAAEAIQKLEARLCLTLPLSPTPPEAA